MKEKSNKPIREQEISQPTGVLFQAALISLVCGATSLAIATIYSHRTEDLPKGIQPSFLATFASLIANIGIYPLFQCRRDQRPVLTAIIALLGLICGAIGGLVYM